MRCGDVLVAVGPLVAIGPLDVAETVVLRLDCHAGLGLRIVSGVLSYAGDVGGALRAFEAARVVRCRVRTGAPDGAGEDDVRCAARVAWAAAQPFRGSRTCLVGRAEPRGAMATAPPTWRSCCSP